MSNENYGFWNLYKRMWSFRSEKIYIVLFLLAASVTVLVHISYSDLENLLDIFWQGTLFLTLYWYISCAILRVIIKFIIAGFFWGVVKLTKGENKEDFKKEYNDMVLHLEGVSK